SLFLTRYSATQIDFQRPVKSYGGQLASPTKELPSSGNYHEVLLPYLQKRHRVEQRKPVSPFLFRTLQTH
ncbi:hypothetical protein, partial [Pokkaliibacter plantistimulans]|uniref:hypothetical protein n=1 Tax=Pokkaliibacter plantistimulans TaxID=1635171 RepID=UPI002D7A1EE2